MKDKIVKEIYTLMCDMWKSFKHHTDTFNMDFNVDESDEWFGNWIDDASCFESAYKDNPAMAFFAVYFTRALTTAFAMKVNKERGHV